MNNNLLISGGISVIIGLILGYMFWGAPHMMNGSMRYGYNDRNDASCMSKDTNNGSHRMSDGSMMGNMMDDSQGMDMKEMMDDMMGGLEGKAGDDFDKAFLSEMIVHHQGAVKMAQAVLTSSTRPDLIKLANDIISAQNTEIQMMSTWQNTWFKPAN
jgi:uncharacterized protein (DUF305 family)